MKKGTPEGQQLDCAVKAGFLPARISSVSLRMCSLTHGFRFGFDKSGMRKVGWRPTPLGTNGYFGSLTIGPGMLEPGTGSKNGPPPFNPTQPAKLDEKSGGGADCAMADPASNSPVTPAKTRPTTRPARSLRLPMDIHDMLAFSLSVAARRRASWSQSPIMLR